MNDKQREKLADKLMNNGNLAIAALLFGQFLSDKSINIYAIILGIFIFFATYLIGYFLLKGEDNGS